MTKTQEQFERVKRWFYQFKDIDEGKVHDRDSDYYQDVIYSFFQNCHHLKDWIIKDSDNSLDSSTVEGYINNYRELRICADLCNATKHLQLNRNIREGQDTEVTNKKISLGLSSKGASIKIKYIVLSGGNKYDSFALANRCVELWEMFLKNNGVL